MVNKLYVTEQENFWAGDFGDEYIARNQSEQLLASNLDFFSKALKSTKGIKNCIEFGANIGMNLMALKLLFPRVQPYAIEINQSAAEQLKSTIAEDHIFQTSILNFEPAMTWDLTLIKGVLIHINPDALPKVYERLVQSTHRYLLVAEYYSPTPVAIPYRGHMDRLFKRDFAGEIMAQHPEMELIDYGFAYRHDPNFPQDDINWFLMKKR